LDKYKLSSQKGIRLVEGLLAAVVGAPEAAEAALRERVLQEQNLLVLA
jgi:hypothetical protein